ncbi:hypothetical protein KQI30_08715 [Clostridium bornimense]|uniref:hypothetical protein n=1 Tax=Clostridium bornimense TaxID=1216932 RepID=UPI001C11F5BD|nr:hypothetical protein [Clostridium bornimense]MBU5316351.1 hypothetical protein [Clostridium bornimense]
MFAFLLASFGIISISIYAALASSSLIIKSLREYLKKEYTETFFKEIIKKIGMINCSWITSINILELYFKDSQKIDDTSNYLLLLAFFNMVVYFIIRYYIKETKKSISEDISFTLIILLVIYSTIKWCNETPFTPQFFFLFLPTINIILVYILTKFKYINRKIKTVLMILLSILFLFCTIILFIFLSQFLIH